MIKLKSLLKEDEFESLDMFDSNKNSEKEKNKPEESNISGNIIIGDSQTPFVAKNSTKVTMIKELQKGGEGVSWLQQQVAMYPISKNINNVVLCIGTNGGYGSKGTNETNLFTALKKTFPNAKIYAVQGSWGWGGIKNKTEEQVKKYYKDNYEIHGAILINTPIGCANKQTCDPHGNYPVYKKIGQEIDNLL